MVALQEIRQVEDLLLLEREAAVAAPQRAMHAVLARMRAVGWAEQQTQYQVTAMDVKRRVCRCACRPKTVHSAFLRRYPSDAILLTPPRFVPGFRYRRRAIMTLPSDIASAFGSRIALLPEDPSLVPTPSRSIAFIEGQHDDRRCLQRYQGCAD